MGKKLMLKSEFKSIGQRSHRLQERILEREIEGISIDLELECLTGWSNALSVAECRFKEYLEEMAVR